jgi:CubicO group peptidase (beta-lactamase class C family)
MNRVKFVCVVTLLTVVLLCGCVSRSSHAGRRRDYWPTLGWRTSSPEEQGMDPVLVSDVDAYAKKNLPDFTSILLIRHGYIIYERYMTGNKDTQRRLWDATKSVTSMVVGLALGGNHLRSVDQKIVDILPELSVEGGSAGSKKITIRHLLTMTSGLEPRPYQGAPDFAQIKSVFAAPLNSSPGTEFHDTYVCPQIISVILTKTTGGSAYEFAKEKLFGPLGIENMQWQQVEPGISDAAMGILMTSRDMAKLGYLYLNDGIWDNRQLIRSQIQRSCRLSIGRDTNLGTKTQISISDTCGG